MGSMMSSAMEDNLKKSQAFMADQQKNTMERQLQMQNMMREKQMAMQLSKAREMFNWWASFYGIAALGMIAGFAKTKKPGVVAPLLPLTFIVGYQYDLAIGNKMERIKADADKILENEMSLLAIPGGLPTIAAIDERRGVSK